MTEGKQHPRIFSLATAGIRYHGYQDYIFHPLRTDFVGDSGFGKSMIGDILQLIFVGAGAFRSATDESRTPDGMVHSGIGYAFLNIEMAYQQYIVIGVYIESSRATHPFIIQNGYDWRGKSSLKPIAEPLSHSICIQGDKLLPLDKFQRKLEDVDSKIIRVFRNNIQWYYEVLRDNDILPINFGKDKRKVEDYVQILHSFARGKDFKRDSASLKNFLFGTEDSAKLLSDFQHDRNMLNSSLLDYQRNKQEIEMIQSISEELSRLQELEQKRDTSHRFYLTAQATHYYRENIKLEQAIREMSVSYTETCWKTLFIRQQEGSIELKKREKELEDFLADTKALEQLRHDLVNNEQELNKCTREKEELESKHTQAQTQSQRLKRVQEWLQPHDGSVEKLQQEFEQQNQIVREHEQLKEFIGYLTNRHLLEDFEFSLWPQDFDKAKREVQARLTVLVKELDKLEVAKSFYDINNPNSLARWAINQGKPLTQEQENILIHFQKLPRSEEVREEGERYLPQPETLFDNIVLKNKQEDGFWLELGAVYEFILSKPQILPLTDSVELKELLEKAQLDAVAEYELLNKEKTNIERLLEGLSDYRFQVSLFQKRHALETFVVNSSLPTSQREFDDALQLLGHGKEIQKMFDELNQTYLALQKKLEELKIRLGVLKEQILAKEQSISAKNQAILETRINAKKNEMASWKKEQTELNTLKTPSDIEGEIKTQLDKIQLEGRSSALKALLEQCLRTEGKLEEELRNLESQIPLVKDSLEKALASYKEILALEFEPDETMAVVDLEQAQREAQRADNAFQQTYEIMVKNNIKNESQRFDGTTDIGLLAHTLLPKIFASPRVEGLDIGKGIADHLNSINEKNRQINQGKVQFLLETFEKVKSRYDYYINLVNDLKRFFKSDDTLITGGFRVSLSLNQSKTYPIEWMNELRRNLRDWQVSQTDLFKHNSGSPEDVILKTFGKYADHSVSDKDIKALLDPKSYFDLSFSLENDGGTTQGSTGQAYTAIALLCIARLSLIEDEGKRGVRFMPIDEAEGIGSNYETLYNLALKYDYQVVSMSIRNVEGVKEAKQNLYILYANPNSELGVNYDPYSDLSYGRLETQNWRKISK